MSINAIERKIYLHLSDRISTKTAIVVKEKTQ